MIRKLLIATMLLMSPALAQETKQEVKTYRPFRYESACIVEKDTQTYEDMCVIIETREKGGALRTRNIYSNKFGLTIKGRFDKEKGYMTWDSHNKFEYKWEYKVGGNQDLGAWTYVMPGFLVQNISWD